MNETNKAIFKFFLLCPFKNKKVEKFTIKYKNKENFNIND